MGAALCATPRVIADSVTIASYFLWPLVVLFGGFVVRTGLKQFSWISVEPEGIRSAGIQYYREALEFLAVQKNNFDFDLMFGDTYSLAEIPAAMEKMAALEEIKPIVDPFK